MFSDALRVYTGFKQSLHTISCQVGSDIASAKTMMPHNM